MQEMADASDVVTIEPIEGSADPDSLAKGMSAQSSAVGDSAAAVDELGFELYVEAFADFLLAENTAPPFTCSIEGPWGSGKSSFMLQLRKRLESIQPGCRTVDFNAWKYEKQDELWAAFALNVTRSLRQQSQWFERVIGDGRLFCARLRGWSEWLSLIALLLLWLLLLVGAVIVGVTTLHASPDQRLSFIRGAFHGAGGNADVVPAWLRHWLSFSPFVVAVVLIVLLVGKLPAGLRNYLFDVQLEKYIDKPDYRGKAAFVDTFSRDFSKMVDAYAPSKKKIFIFIDDLDRTEAPRAADLMQAINLMIGGESRLIFILGLDRAKVASSIAFKFREIVPYVDPSIKPDDSPERLRRFGDEFLEKFIQLSFRVPVCSDEKQARKFVDSLIRNKSSAQRGAVVGGGETDRRAAEAASRRRALRVVDSDESERIRDVLMMVREILEYSPRRLKVFLNEFRMALYIVSSQGLLDVDVATGEAEVTPERLGKFLALVSRYPEARRVMIERPRLINELETRALGFPESRSDIEVEEWLRKPGVASLMCYGIVDKVLTRDWLRRYSMKDFPARKFEMILPSVPVPESGGDGQAAPGTLPVSASADGAMSAGDEVSGPAYPDLDRIIHEDPELTDAISADEDTEIPEREEYPEEAEPSDIPVSKRARKVIR